MTHNPDQSPPLAVKAKNLMGAIGRTATRVVKGESYEATEEEADARMAICNECPASRNRDGECLECGCILMYKVLVASESCELGFWGPARGEPRKGVVRGKDLLEHELELREVLSHDSRTVQAFNSLHERLNAKLRCKSCEKSKLLRKIEVAFSHDLKLLSLEETQDVRDVLPNKTKVMLETVRSWDDILRDKH